jgi:hypothetical protein
MHRRALATSPDVADLDVDRRVRRSEQRCACRSRSAVVRQVDITADPTLSITQADDLAHHVEAHLLNDVRRLAAATVQVSPLA